MVLQDKYDITIGMREHLLDSLITKLAELRQS